MTIKIETGGKSSGTSPQLPPNYSVQLVLMIPQQVDIGRVVWGELGSKTRLYQVYWHYPFSSCYISLYCQLQAASWPSVFFERVFRLLLFLLALSSVFFELIRSLEDGVLLEFSMCIRIKSWLRIGFMFRIKLVFRIKVAFRITFVLRIKSVFKIKSMFRIRSMFLV